MEKQGERDRCRDNELGEIEDRGWGKKIGAGEW